MRDISAAFVGLMVVIAPALANAQDLAARPLSPGEPAGIQKGQSEQSNIVFIGAGLLILGAGLVLASGTYHTPASAAGTSATAP